jgi:hypothetical protein
MYILGLGLTRQLESQHGEGKEEGREKESCKEEVRPVRSAAASAAAG